MALGKEIKEMMKDCEIWENNVDVKENFSKLVSKLWQLCM